jgi:phosphoribosyl-dephospho-CoA transferase
LNLISKYSKTLLTFNLKKKGPVKNAPSKEKLATKVGLKLDDDEIQKETELEE